MPAFDGAFSRSIATPDEARDWTSTGECPYPQFVFYHFTTPDIAQRIRVNGFGEAIGRGGFVWLTRDADDPMAESFGPVRLVVAVQATGLLVPLPHETLEAAIEAVGCLPGEAQADCVWRKGYIGAWDNDATRPWVGIVDPERCRVVENHVTPLDPYVEAAGRAE